MEPQEKKQVWTELASRVGKDGADAVFEMVGLGKGAPAGPMAGRYRLAMIDAKADLPDCPFIRGAKALGQRFREESDQGSTLETHAVYDQLKMAECRCDGWAHACKAMSDANFGKVVTPTS